MGCDSQVSELDLSFFRHTAHRGLFDNDDGVPENSLPAFARAQGAGYAIELDVRLTGDRQLVVFHDETTGRMCGDDLSVARTPYGALSGLRLLGTHSGIPLLSRVLEQVDGRVPLLIELKDPGRRGRAEGLLLEALRGYRGPYAIESFNPFTLLWLGRHAPQTPRGLLGEDPARRIGPLGGLVGFALRGRGSIAAPLAWTMASRAFDAMAAGGPPPAPAILRRTLETDFVAYDIDRLRPDEVGRFRAAGLEVLTWTVRTPAQLAHARALGAGVIFENQQRRLDV